MNFKISRHHKIFYIIQPSAVKFFSVITVSLWLNNKVSTFICLRLHKNNLMKVVYKPKCNFSYFQDSQLFLLYLRSMVFCRGLLP